MSSSCDVISRFSCSRINIRHGASFCLNQSFNIIYFSTMMTDWEEIFGPDSLVAAAVNGEVAGMEHPPFGVKNAWDECLAIRATIAEHNEEKAARQVGFCFRTANSRGNKKFLILN